MEFRSLFKPVYVIPVAVLLVAGLIVVGIVLVAGSGDEDKPRGGPPSLGVGQGDPTKLPGASLRNPKRAPIVRTGVVDEARRIGRLAVAQARGVILDPTRVQIRVSAAPKQIVTVNYQLGCYRNRRARVKRGQYRTRPPAIRQISLPMPAPSSCIATAGAQLTKPDGVGRVKVAVISG